MPHLFRSGKPSPRHPWMIPFLAGVLALLCRADRLIAQGGGGEAAAPGPGTDGAANVVVTQPFPWGGLFVTLLMAGLCLFAVCRSSRRN